MLLTGFQSFCHNSHQAQQMQCALHAQQRLFQKWRRSVQSRVADWMHGHCRATIRRRLRLKGWQSEQQWHAHHETRRCLLLLLALIVYAQQVCAQQPLEIDYLYSNDWLVCVCCFHTDPEADARLTRHGEVLFALVLLRLASHVQDMA